MPLSVDIITVGQLKESYWRQAAGEYTKRLSAYLALHVVEVDDRVSAGMSDTQVLAKEAAGINQTLAKRQSRGRLVLLDIQGKPTSSENLAELLATQESSGHPQLTFIIGG
ncbi:MAG: 23S rRNA (pseudouridine(1915)-N(3))-methyltransferase RlmH, partial [Coriobacteriia bacterium]|nr:23S rRNA (pseudouridine(1915)-N(3))-methyltransferase RlmH [Coriobacteriia bacterium]